MGKNPRDSSEIPYPEQRHDCFCWSISRTGTLLAYDSAMPEKRVRYGQMSPEVFAERAQAMLRATGDMPLDDMERRARALTALAKALKAMGDLELAGGVFDTDDDQLDAAGEQRLRDELLRRILALNADLEDQQHAGEPEWPPAEAGRD